MPYLIDGHNLIPKLGVQLNSIDDEMELIARVGEFCRLRRVQAEIYFDGGQPGQPARRQFGAVTAFFIMQGSSADAAIETRLGAMGKGARNWIVVSSDNRVAVAARALHARHISSEEFVRQVTLTRVEKSIAPGQDTGLTPQEVEEWLSVFRSRPPRP